jgi:hypothetical protein
MRNLVLGFGLGLALASCSKDDGTGRGAASGELTRDRIVEAWKKGGLTPTPLTAATTTVGKDCQSGTVNSVDVLVCQFATPEEAKAAEPKGYEWVGEATGTTVVSGKVLVAASDRRKSDPSGRTIDKLMKLSK